MTKRIQTYRVFESESGQYFNINYDKWIEGNNKIITDRVYKLISDLFIPNTDKLYSDIPNYNIVLDIKLIQDIDVIIIEIGENEEIYIQEKDDEWYYVAIYLSFDGNKDRGWDKCEYFKCDQIDGVIKLLKDQI